MSLEHSLSLILSSVQIDEHNILKSGYFKCHKINDKDSRKMFTKTCKQPVHILGFTKSMSEVLPSAKILLKHTII